MWLYALYLTVSWVNPGALADVDGHTLTLATTTAYVQLDRFATLADCNNYAFLMPISFNGAPMAYTVTARQCRKYFVPKVM